MKFIIQLVSIAVLAFILEIFFPWWSIAISAFLLGYGFKSNANFFAGFLGIGLLWLGKAILIDLNASMPLAENVAAILMLKSKVLLMLATAVIGGLVGGFASLSGSLLRKDPPKHYYN
jgi:hypothetical protein